MFMSGYVTRKQVQEAYVELVGLLQCVHKPLHPKDRKLLELRIHALNAFIEPYASRYNIPIKS